MKTTLSNYIFRHTLFVLLITLLLATSRPLTAAAQSPTTAEKLQTIARMAEEGADAAKSGDTATAATEYDELHDLWETFEDDLRAENPNAYLEMEDKLYAVQDSLQATPIDAPVLYEAFEKLEHESAEVANLISGDTAATGGKDVTIGSFLKDLNRVQSTLAKGDIAAARATFDGVRLDWLSVEGDIATRSAEAYSTVETALGQTNAALSASPPQNDAAIAAIDTIRKTLTPLAGDARYTVFDSAAIILREGLEALLVLVALIAFLERSGNRDKRGWIWTGAGVGVIASIGAAVVLQAVFSRAAAGENRAIIEGATGLIAAALLFYVAYWMHSKSDINAWQKYLNRQTSQALARGSMFGLATLAFLAVFREGAETTVFYLGMVSSITLSDLVLGCAGGLVVLGVIAVLILRFGMKIPMRPFFLAAGLLVYYLGFKFVGTGIHELQIAGVLPASSVDFLQAIPFIGLYPTWEVVATQALLLLAAVLVVGFLQLQHRKTPMSAA